MAKRKIFAELMEGVAAMQGQREGKITVRRYPDTLERLERAKADERP